MGPFLARGELGVVSFYEIARIKLCCVELLEHLPAGETVGMFSERDMEDLSFQSIRYDLLEEDGAFAGNYQEKSIRLLETIKNHALALLGLRSTS